MVRTLHHHPLSVRLSAWEGQTSFWAIKTRSATFTWDNVPACKMFKPRSKWFKDNGDDKIRLLPSRTIRRQQQFFWPTCSNRFSFTARKFIVPAVRFVFLVILMVTVIINILFIIDAKTRLQQQTAVDDPSNRHLLTNGMSEDQKSISIEIVSSQNRVLITIDGSIICDDSEEGKNRGIHILVLNEVSGSIMARRQFDTYSTHEDESMSLFISMVTDGRILLFAIKDEASFQLKKAARDLLTRLGSRQASQLGWRDMWALVVQKQLSKSSNSISFSPPIGESHSKSSDFSSWAAPVTLKVEVPLSPEKKDKCEWSELEDDHLKMNQLFSNFMNHQTMTSKQSSSSMFLADDQQTRARRRHFCSRIEGYGSVCNCFDPLPLRFVSNYDPSSVISQVPIAIIASNRPHYLYRMLRTLLLTAGCNPSMITVFIDGYYDEPLEVAKLFGLRGIQHTPLGVKNARISQHYKASLTAIFNLYPDAKLAIILEEDLDVSPDFYHYFSQTLHLLEEDASLYCISAWNDQAYEHTSGDTSLLYRVETMPGLGWMLSRKLYKEELEARWPSPDKLWDWDMWIRQPEIRKNRECIVPDVSRTFHFGSSGLNMNSYFQDTYFKKHAFNTDPSARLKNVNTLKKANYERLLTKLIRSAYILPHNITPCDANFFKLSPTPKQNVHVLFIRMASNNDFDAWMVMAKCMHVWDLDARGYHRGLWRMHYNGVELIVIGAPHSPYSVFKPLNVVPISSKKFTRTLSHS